MNEVHRAHEREMASACTTADETEKSIETCEDKTEGLENQYRFFQEMRGYVRDLVECLNEKVGLQYILGWTDTKWDGTP